MARTPTGKPNGRPKILIDKNQFEKLCGLQCTLEEIAGFFNCSADTIRLFCKKEYGESFTTLYKRYSQVGKVSLRRWQFKLAEHNATMAIFLGKQILSQNDNIELEKHEDNTMTIVLQDLGDGQ